MAHELMPAAACASASSLRAAGMVMVSEPSMRRDLLSDRARPPNAERPRETKPRAREVVRPLRQSDESESVGS